MFDDQLVFLPQYFEFKQADIEWILNKVSKNYRLQISRPGEGGGEGFNIRFPCKRNKRYVEFGILRVKSYINVPHIIVLLLFTFHIASPCNITSV